MAIKQMLPTLFLILLAAAVWRLKEEGLLFNASVRGARLCFDPSLHTAQMGSLNWPRRAVCPRIMGRLPLKGSLSTYQI